MPAESKKHWKREAALSPGRGLQTEKWTMLCGSGESSFEVQVTRGKKLDFDAVKRNWSFETEISRMAKMRDFFEHLDQFEKVAECPVCKASISESSAGARIWRATYRECDSCTHYYADLRPTSEALSNYYQNNPLGNSVYQNRAEVDVRIRQIYNPKAQWIVQQFERVYGRKPESILDLGAGSGHFLQACRESGLKVSGMEIDSSARKFALETFDISLFPGAEAVSGEFDIVTSFNVIEHLQKPGEFVNLHRKFLKQDGLAVIETPRYHSLTSCLQKAFADNIRGHLFPYGHIQIFSDASLLSVLADGDLAPAAAWYFGQDSRELLCQMLYQLKGSMTETSAPLDVIQEELDNMQTSDLLILACRPLSAS